MTPLTPLERTFINRYQGGFPLCARPFAVVAESLDCDESRPSPGSSNVAC